MSHVTEFVLYYLTAKEAVDNGYTLLLIPALKMRQRANREIISSAIRDLGESGCVVRDPGQNTCAIYRKPAVPLYILRGTENVV